MIDESTMSTDPQKYIHHTDSPSPLVDNVPAGATAAAEMAKFALDPALCGVTVVRSFDGKFGQQDITSLLLELDTQIQRLRGGDMSAVEAMLFAQATALQAIFVDLATRAQRQERLPVMQAQLTMALKAQAQCRATLEALAEVKNPRHPILCDSRTSHSSWWSAMRASRVGTGTSTIRQTN